MRRQPDFWVLPIGGFGIPVARHKIFDKMSSTKKSWPLIRMLLFIVIGLFNTVFIRPEDVGGWKNYLGYAFLLMGAIDAFFLARKYYKNYKAGK